MMNDDGQRYYEENREQEFLATVLGTPWASEIDEKNVYIIDKDGKRILTLTTGSDSTDAIAASILIGLINKTY